MYRVLAFALCLYGIYRSAALMGCGACKRVDLLSIPLELWGAALFAVAALLFAVNAKAVLRPFLVLWFASHLVLLGYQGVFGRYFCPDCLTLAGMEGLLLLLAFLSGKRGKLTMLLVGLSAVSLVLVSITPLLPVHREDAWNKPPGAGEHLQSVLRAAGEEKNTGPGSTAGAARAGRGTGPGGGLRVYDRDGREVTLDSGEPVLFFAWWCPYCPEALLKNRDMALVSTYFRDGVDNVEKTEEKLRSLNINTDRCYYLPRNPPVEKVPEIYTAGGRQF